MVMRFVDLLSRTMMIAAFVLVLFSVPVFNASIAHATIGPTDPGGGGARVAVAGPWEALVQVRATAVVVRCFCPAAVRCD